MTSIQKSTLNPVWNESIIFTELFPPLCQRIKITIKYVECLRENVQAVKYINLRYISNDNEYGFLPTFGPSYLYFYHDNAYAGKILASLDTVLHDESLGIPKSVTKQDVDYVKEVSIYLCYFYANNPHKLHRTNYGCTRTFCYLQPYLKYRTFQNNSKIKL